MKQKLAESLVSSLSAHEIFSYFLVFESKSFEIIWKSSCDFGQMMIVSVPQSCIGWPCSPTETMIQQSLKSNEETVLYCWNFLFLRFCKTWKMLKNAIKLFKSIAFCLFLIICFVFSRCRAFPHSRKCNLQQCNVILVSIYSVSNGINAGYCFITIINGGK